MLSVKGFFSVAALASLLPFVPVCLSSVSDPCPYPSCLCLPLRTSFSSCPSPSRREGAAASSVLPLRTFIVLEANNNLARPVNRGILANYFKKLSLYFALSLPLWYWYFNNKSS